MLNKTLTSALAGSALILGLAFTSNASAFLITELEGQMAGDPNGQLYKVTMQASDLDKSFTVNWLVPEGTGTTLPVDLVASSTWTLKSYEAGEISIDIKIENETILTGLDVNSNAANILSFGVGVDPNSSATLSTSGTYFTGIGTGLGGEEQTFPGGFKGIDICVWTADRCAGGNVNTGLPAEDNDLVVLSLTPTTGSYGSSVDLLFFPIKFQTAWGSFEPAGVPENGTGIIIIPVPEPATLSLLGLGMLAMGALRRRKVALKG